MPFIAHGTAGRGARASRVSRARPAARPGALLVKGTLGVARRLTARRHHRAARPARRAASGCGCPQLLVQIMGFMIRYLDVVTDEMRPDAGGPRVPRLHRPRRPALAGAGRAPPGALFIRSYERGERVHLAMLSPRLHRHPAHGAPHRATPPCRRTQDALDERPRPRRAAGWPSPTPTATRRCTASTCTCTAASGSRCSAPTAPARRRWCCTSTASSPPGAGSVTVSGLPVTKRHTCRRSGAGSASSSRTPTTSCSCRTRARRRRVRAGQPRPARRGARAPGRRRARPGRDGRLRRPAAAPPVLRPAPPGRGRHRAGHGAGDPGARRAVVQPRP